MNATNTRQINQMKRTCVGFIIALAAMIAQLTFAAPPPVDNATGATEGRSVPSILSLAPINLGTTSNFAILSGAAITTTGGGMVTGDVGASPISGSAIGIPAAQVNGTIYSVDASGPAGSVEDPGRLTTAKSDLKTAYNEARDRTPVPSGSFENPNGGNLGGANLVPGLYKFTSTALITGGDVTLTGGPNDVWIFQLAYDLQVGSGIKVILAGGAQARNIFWQVGSSAVLGTYSEFKGTILADQSITMDTGSILEGRALAFEAGITFNGTSIQLPQLNTPPVAVDDTYSVNQDTNLVVALPGVLANDTDAQGDPLTATIVSTVSNGTMSLNADGSFTYTPALGFTGDDSFTYTANDGELNSNVATVTITVLDVNTAPVAVADTYAVDQDTTLVVAAPSVLVNDFDAQGDPLTAILVSTVSNGTLSLDADGSFTYTPTVGYIGQDSFTYKANDGQLDSNVVAVTIAVGGVNTAPVAVADAYNMDQDTTLVVAVPGVLVNDTDAQGDPLTAILVSTVSNGSLSLDADGSFTYTPTVGYIGQDSFTYKANDGQLDSNVVAVTIAVGGVNTAPVAVADTYTMNQDTTLVVAIPGVLVNDTDAQGDPLTAIIVSPVSNGSLSLNPDGSFTYTPTVGFTGQDSFSYKANDGELDSNVTTVTIDVLDDAWPIHDLIVESNPDGVRIESPTCQSGTTNYTKTVAHGANVILEAPEFIGEGASRMRFVRWTGIVTSTNRIIGFQVNADGTVKAWYESSPIRTLTIESNPVGVRIESPTCQSGTTNYTKTVAHGANVILEAPEFIGEGASRMHFVRWTGIVTSTNRIIGFQVNADGTVKAWYESSPIHILTIESNPVGVRIESPTCQSGTTNYTKTVAHGANVILEAPEFIGEGASRMHFVRWTGIVTSTNRIIGFQVNADGTVKAWYESSPIHILTIESDPVGVRIESPTCQSGTTNYTKTVAHGANVILEAPEFIGEGQARLLFERWSGYVTSTNRIISFQVNADVAVKAHYVAAPTSPLLVYSLQERGYKYNGDRTTISRRGALVMDVASGNAALLFVAADGTVTLENWDQEPGSWYTIDAPARAYWMLTNGATTDTSRDSRHHYAEVIGTLLPTPVAIGGDRSISLATSLQGIRRAGTSGTAGTLEQTTIDARLMQSLTVDLNNQGLSHAEGVAEMALQLHVDLSTVAPSQTTASLPGEAAAVAPFGATSVIAYRLNHQRMMVGDGQLDSFSSDGFLLIDPLTSRMQAIIAWRTANNTWHYTVETWCDSFTFSSTVHSGNQAFAVFGARQAPDKDDLAAAAGHFQYRLINGVVKQVKLNGEQVSLPLQLNGAAWQHLGNHGDHGTYGRQTFTANASSDTVRFATEKLSMDQAISWLITNRLPAGAMETATR